MTTRLPPGSQPQLSPNIIVPDHDAPDDLEPLPDAMHQLPHFTETIEVVKTVFRGLPAALVSGDTPIYYEEEGQQRIVRPDCYVAFGVDTVATLRRNGYFMRLVNKPPDFALEIASESTHMEDTGRKRDLYARLGIGEYWRFDATGGEFYREPLVGEVLIDGEYRRTEMQRNEEGLVWGRSETLGLDLCWDKGRLRFYDPVTGEYRLNMGELVDAVAERDRIIVERERIIVERDQALREAEIAIDAERAARQDAETRAAADAEARRDAEAALQTEQAARDADRTRIRQLEEQLRRRQ